MCAGVARARMHDVRVREEEGRDTRPRPPRPTPHTPPPHPPQGACLYLISASMYPAATAALVPYPDPNSPDPANPIYVTDYTHPDVMKVHYVETAAALWEVMASVGWTYTWWLTVSAAVAAGRGCSSDRGVTRGVKSGGGADCAVQAWTRAPLPCKLQPQYTRKPGRGFTLDDTDMLGTIAILVPSLIYLSYNVIVRMRAGVGLRLCGGAGVLAVWGRSKRGTTHAALHLLPFILSTSTRLV